MIDRKHDLPITKQAEVLNISRGTVYYLPRPVSEADLAIMRCGWNPSPILLR
jgi:putative transposase